MPIQSGVQDDHGLLFMADSLEKMQLRQTGQEIRKLVSLLGNPDKSYLMNYFDMKVQPVLIKEWANSKVQD